MSEVCGYIDLLRWTLSPLGLPLSRAFEIMSRDISTVILNRNRDETSLVTVIDDILLDGNLNFRQVNLTNYTD